MKSNKLVVGILAHVDAGKTTLSEQILYKCKAIEKVGRVDHQDTFLDTHSLEKERGITIFSKQALFSLQDFEITLLDTPGHVDFSTEMERTLQVLDYAILVITGADGVQSHTRNLWKLLQRYQVPVFIFVNKMDQTGVDKNAVFVGVSIIPGVELSLKALSGGTAQLPQVSLDAPERVLPRNTVECMQSGVIFGNASMIDGMFERVLEEHGNIESFVATGGYAKTIVPHCKTKITLDENLILDGLYIMYQKNCKK